MKLYFIILFLLFLSAKLIASHIVGGEIYYQYVSNNDYVVYLKVYRDCNTGNANFDDPAYISIFDANNNYLQTISLFTPTITQVQPDINNPCLTVPEGVCVEEAVYSANVNLPPLVGGYALTYQRCCRNSTIDNILSPSNIGSTYTIQIPDTSIASTNNSPFYNNFPPIVVCNNDPLNFDHSATDPDGDSLVYSFCDPYSFDGSTSQPFQADPPPYSYVSFIFPYSGSKPLSASPALSIDSQTGLITGTPNFEGQFVVGVCVSEYRNGQLLSTNKRDFQFNVTNCISTAVNISAFTSSGDTTVIEGCGDITLDFSRSATISANNLILYLTMTGSATNGIDYNLIPDSIIIPAGQTTCQLNISTNFDTLSELLENLIVTINNDTICINEASANINIYNSDAISLSLDAYAPNIAICKDEEATITAYASGGDGGFTYLWSNGGTDNVISVSPDSTKQYYVDVIDSCGNRTATDTVTVYVVCDMDIPNVFTPNGDGLNDLFYIENLYMHPNSDLKIYSRWGRLVYESSNYDNSWDGGKVSGGTYYYILDAPEITITKVGVGTYTYPGLPQTGFLAIFKNP